ncbi:MAG TPA: transcription elongation factor GreA [Caldisericia bacterium]|nr:transcription elongation factor GreA [Caldisericia bacterium]HXK52248.1 transcription elongation factor GreA [Caldisericia bacterium]
MTEKEEKKTIAKKASKKKSTSTSKKKTTKCAPKSTKVKKEEKLEEKTPTTAEKKPTESKSTAKKTKTSTDTKTVPKASKTSTVDISSGYKEKESDGFKLTKRGLEILKSELKELKTVKRAEISERIRQARALGDLSENSEYEDAKREQAVVEIRISELENMLRKSIIVDEDNNDDNSETVRMGHSVVIESIESKEKQTFKIVSVLEADPFTNAISNLSPLGSALLGHQVGNVIRVVLPIGAVRYRLVEIRKKES